MSQYFCILSMIAMKWSGATHIYSLFLGLVFVQRYLVYFKIFLIPPLLRPPLRPPHIPHRLLLLLPPLPAAPPCPSSQGDLHPAQQPPPPLQGFQGLCPSFPASPRTTLEVLLQRMFNMMRKVISLTFWLLVPVSHSIVPFLFQKLLGNHLPALGNNPKSLKVKKKLTCKKITKI